MAYIEAALWSSNDDSTPQGGKTARCHTVSRILIPTPWRKWPPTAKRFQEENATDLARYDHSQWTAAELGGHDFC